MVQRIPLSGVHGKGRYVLVDDEDYERFAGHRWYAQGATSGWPYAARRVRTRRADGSRWQRMILMHREIMEAPPRKAVDHIDGNTLNNTRGNLRFADARQNAMNAKKQRSCSSVYKGVCWNRVAGRWQVQIMLKGKQEFLGFFDNEENAALAYDKRARELFGEYARPNFPEEDA